MRSEHGHAAAAPDVILPFGGMRVPMQLAHTAWLDDEKRAGHGGGDRELGGRHPAQRAADKSSRLLNSSLFWPATSQWFKEVKS